MQILFCKISGGRGNNTNGINKHSSSQLKYFYAINKIANAFLRLYMLFKVEREPERRRGLPFY